MVVQAENVWGLGGVWRTVVILSVRVRQSIQDRKGALTVSRTRGDGGMGDSGMGRASDRECH